MVRSLIGWWAGAAAVVLVIIVCLHINPGAADWRRLVLPALSDHHPPAPSPIGFADVTDTWLPPERFGWYRGSESRDGIYRDGVIAPPLTVAWATEAFNVGIHGASKSSPAVDATGIYVGSDSGYVRAFAHDGRPRWKFKVTGAARGIHATPVLSRRRVYVGSYGGTFYVLDKNDGRLIWTFHNDQTAFGSSPMVVDGTLIAAIETETLNAFVTALDAETGRARWRSPFLGEQIHSSPAYDAATGTIVIGANNKALFGLNAANGEIRWRRYLGGEIKGTPLVADGVAYVSSWAAKLHAVNVTDGSLRWESELDGISQSSPTLVPGSDVLVVGARRGIFGIDRRSGRRVWAAAGGSAVMSSALVARDRRGAWRAWIGCGSKELCAFDVGGRLIQTIALPGRLTGVPVAFDDALYVSLDFPGGLVKLTGAANRAKLTRDRRAF